VITFKGIETVTNIELIEKKKTPGEHWAKITFSNGLTFSTFSQTAIKAAQDALVEEKPLAYQGTVETNEWEGKTYPNFNIKSAWMLGAKREPKPATVDEEDLPF